MPSHSESSDSNEGSEHDTSISAPNTPRTPATQLTQLSSSISAFYFCDSDSSSTPRSTFDTKRKMKHKYPNRFSRGGCKRILFRTPSSVKRPLLKHPNSRLLDSIKFPPPPVPHEITLEQQFTTSWGLWTPYKIFPIICRNSLLLTVTQNFESCGPPRGPWSPGWEPLC